MAAADPGRGSQLRHERTFQRRPGKQALGDPLLGAWGCDTTHSWGRTGEGLGPAGIGSASSQPLQRRAVWGGQAPGRGRIPQPGAAARWPAWRKSLARRRPVSKQRPLAVPRDTAGQPTGSRRPRGRAESAQPSSDLSGGPLWMGKGLAGGHPVGLRNLLRPCRPPRGPILGLGPGVPTVPSPVAGPGHTGWPLRPQGPSQPAPPPPASTQGPGS